MTAPTLHRKLTQDELMAEARARFGADPMDIAFRCPNCGDVATVREWTEIGEQYAAGQACIGRAKGVPASRGCSHVAYGLICGPWEIVIPAAPGRAEHSIFGFPLADGPRPAPQASLPEPDDDIPPNAGSAS